MVMTHRDFLNGVALTVAAGLAPATQVVAQPPRYPPALTGLRGPARRIIRVRPTRTPAPPHRFRQVGVEES
jgi:hypothetical protein